MLADKLLKLNPIWVILVSALLMLCWVGSIVYLALHDPTFVSSRIGGAMLISTGLVLMFLVAVPLLYRYEWQCRKVIIASCNTQDDAPTNIIGWKVAAVRILGSPSTRLAVFESLRRNFYVSDDVAICEYQKDRNKAHEVPELTCDCGFYAFNTLVAAKNTVKIEEVNCLLQVEAYGKIILHERGWRAEQQQVMHVLFDSHCFVCKKEASLLVNRHGKFLKSTCVFCADKLVAEEARTYAVTLSQLQNMLRTEVKFSPLCEKV